MKSPRWSAKQAWNVTETMQKVERDRAANRSLIDGQFNGMAPYTPSEVEKYQIHINVNWLEGQRLASTAINQLNNALIFKDRLVTLTSKGGKIEKRQEYSETVTKLFNEPLKSGDSGKAHMFLLKSRNAAVALHGIGPILWNNDFKWKGRFVPLEDLLIPTDTLCDFSNLMFFGVNLYLTSGEFFDMTNDDKVDKGWNRKMVSNILKDLIKPDQAQASQYFTLQDQPEKQMEWLKQNRFAWDYDAAATVKLRLFFYKSENKWHRCIILREGTPSVPANMQEDFLYDGGSDQFADNINEILHVQFGDNSICAPLKYQSVRGLGVSLYGPVEANNRLRCELVQHVLFQMKTLLRVSNPADRDRPKVLDLSQYSVIEDGVSFVPAAERYHIDPRLVENAQAQMRQLMSESSSSFVQDINDGTSREMTATETEARVQSVNVQVSAMLQSMYAQEEYYYQELVRRFFHAAPEDEEVKEFQKKCRAEKIPKELMEADNWGVKIERVLGAGDQFLAAQEANALLGQSQRFDPTSQRAILRQWVSTTTRDPKMAELLVPADPNEATPGVIAAEDVFGTLMAGIKAHPREGIDRGPYIESLLGMMQAVIQRIESTDNMGTPQEFIGLNKVGEHIEMNLQILAQDESQKPMVKMFSDQLGNLMNLVKAFGQRQQQAAEEAAAASQINPEAQAKAQATAMLAEQKVQISQAASEQKMMMKQQQFEQQMMQMFEKHQMEMAAERERLSVEVTAEGLKTGAQISNEKAKTAATIANQKKMAAAKPKNVNKSE